MFTVDAALSGAGKTTMLNVITGTIGYTCGQVTLNGEPIDERSRRQMGYVMQQDVFYPTLTLRETLTVSNHVRPSICSGVATGGGQAGQLPQPSPRSILRSVQIR